jgi:Ca2+/H+ antiporter, TMEM165/GDT1 family
VDALLSAFLAALISEQGDASQLLALAVVARFGAGARPVSALLIAAGVGAALSATAGAGAHLLMPHRGALLLAALALLFAGFGMAFAPKPPKVEMYARLGPFGAVLLAATVQMFGDRTQFLVFALSARSDAPVLAALGGAAGACAGLVPAVLLGPAFRKRWPVTTLRWTGAALFAFTGTAMLLSALRLI